MKEKILQILNGELGCIVLLFGMLLFSFVFFFLIALWTQ